MELRPYQQENVEFLVEKQMAANWILRTEDVLKLIERR